MMTHRRSRFFQSLVINLYGWTVAWTILIANGMMAQEPNSANNRKTSAVVNSDTDDQKPFRIAAIVTSYFPTSHAAHIVGKFIRGFPTDDGLIAPRTEIASLFVDQVHEQDIGRQIAKKHDIPLYESIRAALTLGTNQLAVDGVLLIAEHGDYARSTWGQEMLPRRYFMEQITGVIAKSGRPIPIYNDKHFSYRWDDAQWMYERTRELRVPLWAASAIPIVWRKPHSDCPAGAKVDRALVIGFHMLERYGFHALSVLQSQVERRAGGETGVRSVQCLSGDDVWRAGKDGRWSLPLANAALRQIEDGPGELDPSQVKDPHVFLVDYDDGLQAAVLVLGDTGYVNKFAYAQQRGDTTDVWEYHVGPIEAAFGYLSLNIENFFLTGIPPSPVERTYLVTGILEAAMISNGRDGQRVETAHLSTIEYQPSGHVVRPQATRPSGASLDEWISLEPGATPQAAPVPITRDGTLGGSKKIVE